MPLLHEWAPLLWQVDIVVVRFSATETMDTWMYPLSLYCSSWHCEIGPEGRKLLAQFSSFAVSCIQDVWHLQPFLGSKTRGMARVCIVVLGASGAPLHSHPSHQFIRKHPTLRLSFSNLGDRFSMTQPGIIPNLLLYFVVVSLVVYSIF